MTDCPHILQFEGGKLDGLRQSVARDLFGWPLPARLKVLAHPGLSGNMALWDADAPAPEGLPNVIVESPDIETYIKISESQLPKDVPNVARGAVYALEAR